MLNAFTNVATNTINAIGFQSTPQKQFSQGSPDADLSALVEQKIHEHFTRQYFNDKQQNGNKQLRFTDNGRFGKPTRAVNGDPICFACGKVGHTAARCYSRNNNRQNRNNNRPRNNNQPSYENTPPAPASNQGPHIPPHNNIPNPNSIQDNGQQQQSNSQGVRMSGNFAPQSQ